jgi:hypothetical protein
MVVTRFQRFKYATSCCFVLALSTVSAELLACPADATAAGGSDVPAAERCSADNEAEDLTSDASRRSGDVVTCRHCQGKLMEEIVRWTEELLAQLDKVGVVDNPVRAEVNTRDRCTRRAERGEPSRLPKFKLRLRSGNFGLTARMTF